MDDPKDGAFIFVVGIICLGLLIAPIGCEAPPISPPTSADSQVAEP